ncbi:MAG: DnaJ domain-containing protein, partial [Arcobacteraceae bacterium]|nr:DnaJ domain-containing protein [Arcobacteraceae bacterium]
MTDMCYYELLEISKDSDKSTIKKAYRKMAMKYHP